MRFKLPSLRCEALRDNFWIVLATAPTKSGTGRFGKKNFETFRNILVLFLFFSTNWLGPVCRIPVCRILELKKNYKTINVGMMQSIKRASDMSPFPLVPRGPLYPNLAKRGRTGAKT